MRLLLLVIRALLTLRLVILVATHHISSLLGILLLLHLLLLGLKGGETLPRVRHLLVLINLILLLLHLLSTRLLPVNSSLVLLRWQGRANLRQLLLLLLR